MQLKRYADFGAARRLPADAPANLRHSGLVRCLIVCPAFLLAPCRQEEVLDPQRPIVSAQRLLLINATEIRLVVVVPVVLATLGFAWWRRSSNVRAGRSPDWAYQGGIELVIWSIPALMVILLGGVCWVGSHQLDPRASITADAKPLEVDVVALGWKWLFIYPDQADRGGQPARCACGNADPFSPDIGDGDELVFPRRQHSRHHFSKKSES